MTFLDVCRLSLFVILCFIVLCRYSLVFCKFKVYGSCWSSKSFSAIFQQHFLSLCHILITLTIFQTFLFLLHFIMVIFDQWSLLLLFVWGHHIPYPYNMLNLVSRCWCVLITLPTGQSSMSLPLLGSPYSLRDNSVESRSVNNLQWLVSVQVKGSHFNSKARNDETYWRRYTESRDGSKNRPLVPNNPVVIAEEMY